MKSQFMVKAKVPETKEWIKGYFCELLDHQKRLLPHVQVVTQIGTGHNVAFYVIDPDSVCRSIVYEDKYNNPIFEDDLLVLDKNVFVDSLHNQGLINLDTLHEILDYLGNENQNIHLSVDNSMVFVEESVFGSYRHCEIPLHQAEIVGNLKD